MTIVQMTYKQAREQIKDGQIIFVRGTGIIGKIMDWATSGNFTHCGIAIWMTDDSGKRKLMCLESWSGGARIVTARAYAPRGITVLDLGVDWNAHGPSMIDRTGVLDYNWYNFFLIGVREVLMKANINLNLTKLSSSTKVGEVCSEFCATFLESAGLMNTTFVSPNRLYKLLLNSPALKGGVATSAEKSIR